PFSTSVRSSPRLYTLSLHDALPISHCALPAPVTVMLLHATLKFPRLKIAAPWTFLDVTPLTVDSATPAISNPWMFDPLPSRVMFLIVMPVRGPNIFRAVAAFTDGL